MRSRLVALALLSTPIGAGDFRAVDFGESCDAANAYEAQMDSVAVPWTFGTGNDTLAFKGRDFDHDLLVAYFCPGGMLAFGHYYFPLEEMNSAVDTFRKTQDQLTLKYGQPFLDNTPWQVGALLKLPGWIEQKPQYYFMAWRTPRSGIDMRLLLTHFPTEESGYRVVILVTPQSSDVRSNNRIERPREP